MEQLVNNLMASWGVPVSVLLILSVVWLQLKPQLFLLLRKQAAQIDKAEWRALAVGLVRAAEQLFSDSVSPTVNEDKQSYVRAQLRAAGGGQLGDAVLTTLIEAAVHEVKAPLKAATTATATE